MTWIAGPSRGLLAAARSGYLPTFLQRRNKAGVQVGILNVQGIVVTLLAALFIFVPNINTAFILLVDMAAALYLIMYMMMFAAAMRLRRTHAQVVRTYRTPAMGLIATIGFIACFAAFALRIRAAEGFAQGAPGWAYPLLVAVVVIILGVPPLIFYAMRKPHWDQRTAQEKAAFDDVLVNPGATAPETAQPGTSSAPPAPPAPTAPA
ncbi:amino acid permease [Leifsonia sp. L25]|uniref:amino acid permease n=1 Tax=Leifsonia sp. L25 TaxID=3423957 RepID=UPI003D69C98E